MFSITIRERSGQVYTFHFDKPEVLIGRVKGNDVILPKQNISKRHALIRVHGPRFVVEDLGSTNGTYVNGHRIANAVEIGAEDKVYLGDFVMNFLDLSHGGVPADMPPVPELPELPELDEDALGLPRPSASARETALSAVEPSLPPLEVMSSLRPSGVSEPEPLFDDQFDLGDLEALAQPPATAPQASAGSFDGDDLELPLLEAFSPEKPTRRSVGEEIKHTPNEPTRAYGSEDRPDRTTGPVDGLSALADEMFGDHDNARRPAPPLSAVPGLAGALKMPPPASAAPEAPIAPKKTTMQSAAPQEPAPVGKSPPAAKPVKAPVQTSAPQPLKTTAQYQAPIPQPVAQNFEAGFQPPEDPHFDALAVLYRNALRDLRPAVPSDAAQMSDSDWAEMEDRVMAFVDGALQAGEVPADADLGRLKRDLIYELAGLGPLEPMLDDPGVESVEVNGPAQLYVFRQGRREAVQERFSCQQALAAAVDRLVRATGNPVHKGALHADGTLIDGTTVRVVWPPLCPQGPAVLLRKPRGEAPTVEQLIERGAMTEKVAIVLRYLVSEGRSIAICGAPNVGRRTVVNALAQLLAAEERIVVVEDGQRLRLDHAHVVRLDSAAVPEEGPSVLQIARRLMPDRLLLGECVGVSTAELFTVAADGLPPWIGSFHARSIDDFVERATHAMVIHHPGIPESVAKSRVTRAVDAVACFEFDHESGKEMLRAVAVLNTTGFGPPFKWLSPEDFEGARA